MLPAISATALAALSPPPSPSNRNCYGCLGWCTYGDLCEPPDHAKWYDVDSEIGTQGRGWPTSALPVGKPYTRFPAKAKSIVDSGVWAKAERSAGLKTRFSTNATDLWVNWHIPGGWAVGDWLWPPTGHAGIDIYVEDEAFAGSGVHQRWAGSSGNNPMMSKQHNTTRGLITGVYSIPPRSDGQPRNFTVYLPLAVSPLSVRIAAMDAHSAHNVPLTPIPPPTNGSLPGSSKPVLWYGTSIMNGAAANRPGMGWPQQAERMLGMEGINIGFGGMGLMQPYYASSGLLSEIDYSVAVVDCEFNMNHLPAVEVYNRTLVFISSLKSHRPHAPVLLMEGHDHGQAWISTKAKHVQNATREAYRRAYNTLLKRGVKGLHYAQGSLKFGGRSAESDFEASVSTCAGVHPVPLGLRAMASHVSAIVGGILRGETADDEPQPTGGQWPPLSFSPPLLPEKEGTLVAAGTNENAGEDMDGVGLEDWWRRRVIGWRTANERPDEAAALRWVDARTLNVEGKGWRSNSSGSSGGNDSNDSFWTRFPPGARNTVPANIWRLSQQPSGMLVRFSTNSSSVGISITRSGNVNNTDDIFTTNGKQGFDCYVQDGRTPLSTHPRWRWAATEAGSSGKTNGSLIMTSFPPLASGAGGTTLSSSHRNFTIYLPTYVAVQSLRVGVDAGADVAIEPLQVYSEEQMERPVVVWGSSIAQGGVASNAGMTWPANLQRMLDEPLLNFGFSGSCGMQPSVAATMAQLAPSPRAFVMDCLPNMQGDTFEVVYNRTLAIVAQLRTAFGPSVPILVLEGHKYTNNWIRPNQANVELGLAAAQQRAVENLTAQGLPNLHYATSTGKLGSDVGVAHESTGGVGVHPTSLAHLHMGAFVASKLAAVL